jgi:putative glutamine amidotransferase
MTYGPLIGVTTSELRPAEGAHVAHHGEPPRRMMALGTAYLEAIAEAGGIPVVLAPMPPRDLGRLLDRLDAICLAGGPDLEPATYGAGPHPELGTTEPEVDYFELGIARAARRRGLPLLAICRGLQVLNVSRGGTLVQHLPERTSGCVNHRQEASASVTTHSVRVEPGSRLGGLLGAARAEVNSFHHQGVDRLGNGLVAVAWDDDGVVEAIEATSDAFALGVQWHAECLTGRDEHAALFRGLIEAAEADSPAAERAA